MRIPNQAQILVLSSNACLWEAAQAVLAIAGFFGERPLCVYLDEPSEEWRDLLERMARTAFQTARSHNLLLEPEEFEGAPTEGRLEILCFPQRLIILRRLAGAYDAYSEQGTLEVSLGPRYPALQIWRWVQGDEPIAAALKSASGGDLRALLEARTTPG